MRILNAYLVAPLIASGAYATYFYLGVNKTSDPSSVVVLVFVISSLVSYAATAFVGVPTYLILNRLNRLTIKSLAVLGFIEGFFVIQFASIAIGDTNIYNSLKNILAFLLLGGGLGACVSIAFGYIAGLTPRSSGTPQKRGAP